MCEKALTHLNTGAQKKTVFGPRMKTIKRETSDFPTRGQYAAEHVDRAVYPCNIYLENMQNHKKVLVRNFPRAQYQAGILSLQTIFELFLVATCSYLVRKLSVTM